MICCTRLMLLMQKAMQQSQKAQDYQDMHATCAAQNSMIRNIYNSIERTRTKHLTIFRMPLLFVSGTLAIPSHPNTSRAIFQVHQHALDVTNF